jgi:hypothetical protein
MRWTRAKEGIQVASETAQVDDIQLTAQPSAVNCTDIFVRFTLAEWSLRPMLDDATHTACEVVSAAVDSADQKSPGFITVRLRLRGDCLVIEVSDDQVVQPRALPSVLKGRRAGVEPLRGRGKLVWCELPLPEGVSASKVPLPRRERRASPAAEQLAGEPAEVDPQVIQRILSGLGSPPEQPPE